MKSARANGGPRLTYHEILKKKYGVLHSCREIVGILPCLNSDIFNDNGDHDSAASSLL